MKHNYKSIISTISEYIVLIVPTGGYAIYTYCDTLTHTMSSSSKGCFWSLIALAVVLGILYGIFKKRYDRYVQGYVQQKTDLETNPDNVLLIKKVAEKKTIVENLDYIPAIIGLLIALTVVYAFKTALDQLVVLLLVLLGSIAGKVGLHILTINLEKSGMLKKGDDEQ